MKAVQLVVAAVLSFSSLAANATLITNGSFEEPNISSGWTYLADAPGGWQGDNIEVWASGFNGVVSYEGGQHGELNAHPYDGTSFSIYQTFDTTLGAAYEFSMAYRARSSNNESFMLDIFTGTLDTRVSIVSMLLNDHTTAAWSTLAGGFEGTGTETYFMLTSIVPNAGTVGNFIDAVVVTEVPEPATIALMGLGLAGLIGARRKVRS